MLGAYYSTNGNGKSVSVQPQGEKPHALQTAQDPCCAMFSPQSGQVSKYPIGGVYVVVTVSLISD
jgi:hypothetical protein